MQARDCRAIWSSRSSCARPEPGELESQAAALGAALRFSISRGSKDLYVRYIKN